MTRLTDLPPEIRLNIYQLLLVDPIRDGLRITLTFDPLDNDKRTWSRARCAQTEQPHNEGHAAGPCCVDVPPFSLHHLDFTDLWSLARASKTLYAEASKTIYNNADLTYAFGELPPLAKSLGSTSASTPLGHYLEQHSPTTRAMICTLVIHGKSATMSPREMKAVVDIVNSHLPNLRVFGYHVSANTAGSFMERVRNSCREICRTPKDIQPLAHLKADIRLFLELPDPVWLASTEPTLYERLCSVRRLLSGYAMETITQRVRGRRVAQDFHGLALDRGVYLHITSALRSSSAVKVRVSKHTALMEEALTDLHSLFDCEYVFRGMKKHARAFK